MSELYYLNIQMVAHKLNCPTCHTKNLTCKIAEWLKEYLKGVKNE